jgi:deoxyribonuclease V
MALPMTEFTSHSWLVSPREAATIQSGLRDRVERTDRLGPLRLVAGVDVGIHGDVARAAIAVLAYPEMELVDLRTTERRVEFPYVPGLLAFREAPAILEAWACLRSAPDLILFDGQGLAHPRRLGIACHLGLVLDRPSIGCAKSRLCGEYEEPGSTAGEWTPLVDGLECIGAAVRTRTGTKPVFVSLGHRVSLETAISLTLACCRGYRLPEPTRQAHLGARQVPAETRPARVTLRTPLTGCSQ